MRGTGLRGLRAACLPAVLAGALLWNHPSDAGGGPWQVFHVETPGAVYEVSPEEIARTGDLLDVRVRSVEPTGPGAERVAWVRYRLNCRQGTFQVVETIEERGTERSVCTTVSDEIPIRPQKHRHIEALRTRFCF